MIGAMSMPRLILLMLTLALAVAFIACGDDGGESDEVEGTPEATATTEATDDGGDDGGDGGGDGGSGGGNIELTSTEFEDGDTIPVDSTCDGDDMAPPLSWTAVPAEAKFLALVMDDPDADGFLHWVVFDVPVKVTGFGAVGDGAELPSGGKQAQNDFGDVGYGGPCPPEGEEHTYSFRIYALAEELGLDGGVPGADVMAALDAASPLDQGELTAVYARQ